MATGAPVVKELAKSDTARVQDVVYKAGDVSPSAKRDARAIYVVQGGVLEREYADGKTTKVVFKTGEARIFPTEDKPFAVKNLSKHGVHLIIFFAK